ncbi:hypothetical protein [Anaeroselena agilis]|uniref:Uncharacterized protein n=1 Tax=Anaeroselena agilis TaxID=3063788 RepID=A0ABU3NVP2_9FIRM|nr:hypothetical protein [Selenomonadales bacterium 4137-cl]
MTLDEFMQLPPNLQLDRAVKLFIEVCTAEPLFLPTKKINPVYFRIRNYMASQKVSPVSVWEFLQTWEPGSLISVGELMVLARDFQNAKRFREGVQKTKQADIKEYDQYHLDMLR